MRCFQKCSAALVLAASLLLPSAAFAEEGFTFDGFGPTGTVQELWNTLKSKGYNLYSSLSSSWGFCVDDPVLYPKEVMMPAPKYAGWNILELLEKHLLVSVHADAQIGDHFVRVHILTEAGGPSNPANNINPVLGLRINHQGGNRDEFTKLLYDSFSSRYGEPQKFGTYRVWQGKNQRAYFSRSENAITILNTGVYDELSVQLFKMLDEELVKKANAKENLKRETESRF